MIMKSGRWDRRADLSKFSIFSISSETAAKIDGRPFINFWTMNFDSGKNSVHWFSERESGKNADRKKVAYF